MKSPTRQSGRPEADLRTFLVNTAEKLRSGEALSRGDALEIAGLLELVAYNDDPRPHLDSTQKRSLARRASDLRLYLKISAALEDHSLAEAIESAALGSGIKAETAERIYYRVKRETD